MTAHLSPSSHLFSASPSTTLCVVALAAILVGCTSDAARHESAAGVAQLSRSRMAAEPMTPGPPTDRVIIRRADLDVEVDDVGAARTRAEVAVTARAGYVEAVHESEDTVHLQLRVPASELDAFLSELEGLGKVVRSSVSSTDVTEQHADLQVRLANSRKLRDRLLALLDKATTVEEMLAVEKELARVQSEVERLQGQLDRLNGQVALSSVSLTLRPGRILGPLGYVGYGVWWVLEKLFVIR